MLSNARHRQVSATSPDALIRRLWQQGKWHYLLLLPSDLARNVLSRKYDAFTTDEAYDVKPRGRGLNRLLDRLVRGFPVHQALRDRLQLVRWNLVTEAVRLQDEGLDKMRVLTAPCGLMRDVLVTHQTLERRHCRTSLEVLALDLDDTGEVLDEARRRSESAGLTVRFKRQDLLNSAGLKETLSDFGKVHAAVCIGLSSWLTMPEVERLAESFRSGLVPGGLLVIDNFAPHAHSHMSQDLEIHINYHDPQLFRRSLERAGFHVESERMTPSGIVTVTALRARP